MDPRRVRQTVDECGEGRKGAADTDTGSHRPRQLDLGEVAVGLDACRSDLRIGRRALRQGALGEPHRADVDADQVLGRFASVHELCRSSTDIDRQDRCLAEPAPETAPERQRRLVLAADDLRAHAEDPLGGVEEGLAMGHIPGG